MDLNRFVEVVEIFRPDDVLLFRIRLFFARGGIVRSKFPADLCMDPLPFGKGFGGCLVVLCCVAVIGVP